MTEANAPSSAHILQRRENRANMWNVSFMGFTLYQILAYFFVYSVVGWLMETVLVSVQQRHLVKRGFLYGCYCPIYGCGMCLIILFLSPLEEKPVLLYFAGALLATALEYFTSWSMEKLFNARWWDYSRKPFNLNGRVCLHISLAWGLLALLIIYGLNPALDDWLMGLDPQIAHPVLLAVSLLFLLDLGFSLWGAFNMSGRIRALSEILDNARVMLLQNAPAEALETLRARLQSLRPAEMLTGRLDWLRSLMEKNFGGRPREALSERESESARRRARLLKRLRIFERRVLRAYPHFKLTRINRLADQIGQQISKRRDEQERNRD